MKKIPSCVQSLICASNQINNHRKAVEELVYNALDAGATSIALRINIQENTLQVIDNGCGMSYKDLRCIGEKYMTSNFVDLGTLKSAPIKYGFCGQSLPNLINVSKTVKITSRREKSEETWMKLFENGKEKQLKLCNIRPSKGTTIEIKGLLYNLKIHKKDILNELQSIKTFMEHVALVHSNISLSLRDDSRNEIIFKMHKNRDMYQTLSTLYNIGREDIQELQVEKNKYKVTAFLGNSDNEYGKDFIFINGKFIPNTSKLHKTVNNNLSKQNKLQGVRKPNNKNFNKDEENSLFQKKKPYYFIFIKCPYIDYSMGHLPKQSSLEFKDWNQVMKLLNKLIQFSKGDMRFFNKKVISIEKDNETNNANKNNTKEQVKKIVDKILGTHSKKPGVTHLHNGIKGKQIKRKVWKPPIAVAPNVIKLKENYNKELSSTDKVMDIDISDGCKVNINKPNEKLTIKKKENYVSPKQKGNKNAKANIKKSCIKSHIGKAYNSKFKKVSKNNEEGNAINIQLQKQQLVKKANKNKKLGFNKGGLVLRKFEMQTDSVKKRCNELEQRTRNLLKQLHERNHKQFVIKNNINVSVYKQTDEIIIHNFKPKALQNKITNNNLKSKEFRSNYDLVKTILQSQQGSNEQRHIDHETNNSVAVRTKQRKSKTNKALKSIDNETEVTSSEPVITFQSHKYYAHSNMNIENNAYRGKRHMNLQNEKDNDNLNVYKNPRTFITEQSRENFIIPNTSHKHNILKKKCNRSGYAKQFKSSIKRLFNQTSKNVNMKQQIMHNLSKSSHTIEFTESSFHVTDNKRFQNFFDSSRNHESNTKRIMDIQESGSQLLNYNNFSVDDDDHIALNTNTYTVSNINNNGYTIEEDNWNLYSTYNIEHANDKTIENNTLNVDISFDDNCLNHQNFIFISKSQEHEQNKEILNAIYVCETILQSQEMFDKEIIEPDVNNIQNLNHNIIEDTNLQKWQIKVNEQKTTEHKGQITHDERIHTQDFLEEFSQYFDLTSNNIMEVNNVSKANDISVCSIINTKLQKLPQNTTVIEKQRTIQGNDKVNNTKHHNVSEFNFKNRLCFLPKGMSPIFENCHTRKNCEYNLSEDYYDDEMYNNFVYDVKNNAEVFKPKIHEAKEFTSKAIDKVNFKLNKDNSSLKFNGRSLKTAKVLGQIDEKFIAAIMKGGCNIEDMLDFLVLFDQHAVHERIRLENNLSDYLSENQWKPVNIDDVTLKMSQDDILYLHNYRHKFEQVGLKWTVVNTNEVSFDAIPQAILGKNPRPVDKVIKAVKNLITEEINMIKMQGGCVSYPKSIMDLVFSEACRYAIKFGDKLSKSECVELIKNLSECKTPFQCAHGRPVMAVMMGVKLNIAEYKVNCNRITDWNGTN